MRGGEGERARERERERERETRRQTREEKRGDATRREEKMSTTRGHCRAHNLTETPCVLAARNVACNAKEISGAEGGELQRPRITTFGTTEVPQSGSWTPPMTGCSSRSWRHFDSRSRPASVSSKALRVYRKEGSRSFASF